MKSLFILFVLVLTGCQQQKVPQYGNATVYTTPGGVGGVSYTKYEMTPL